MISHLKKSHIAGNTHRTQLEKSLHIIKGTDARGKHFGLLRNILPYGMKYPVSSKQPWSLCEGGPEVKNNATWGTPFAHIPADICTTEAFHGSSVLVP